MNKSQISFLNLLLAVSYVTSFAVAFLLADSIYVALPLIVFFNALISFFKFWLNKRMNVMQDIEGNPLIGLFLIQLGFFILVMTFESLEYFYQITGAHVGTARFIELVFVPIMQGINLQMDQTIKNTRKESEKD